MDQFLTPAGIWGGGGLPWGLEAFMKKLVGLGVLLIVAFFFGETLLEQFQGTPAAPGQEESLNPGMKHKAATAGSADRQKKHDKLDKIGDE
jgi:hypothetical protein